MFKDFSIFSSGGHLVYRSGTVLAILLGSHRGNIPMKFESHWPKGSGKVGFKANYSRFSIFSSGGHFFHRSKTKQNHFNYFVRGSPNQISYEV